MKVKTVSKILSIVAALYAIGFFAVPPWAYAWNSTFLRNVPLIAHDIFYRPVLHASGPEGWITALWLRNANYWCKQSNGCVSSNISESI